MTTVLSETKFLQRWYCIQQKRADWYQKVQINNKKEKEEKSSSKRPAVSLSLLDVFNIDFATIAFALALILQEMVITTMLLGSFRYLQKK
jgi:hypothetical protein